jgi:hypothetical protein
MRSAGENVPAWADRCPAACYDCLLSYSNQQDHRYLNRTLIITTYLWTLASMDFGARRSGQGSEPANILSNDIRNWTPGDTKNCTPVAVNSDGR